VFIGIFHQQLHLYSHFRMHLILTLGFRGGMYQLAHLVLQARLEPLEIKAVLGPRVSAALVLRALLEITEPMEPQARLAPLEQQPQLTFKFLRPLVHGQNQWEQDQ
jgi:hypothetical protein